VKCVFSLIGTQSAPWGIVFTCITAACTGFIYILGLLYSTLDLDQAIEGSNAAVVAYVGACGPALGKILANLLLSNFFFAGVSSVTVTSRIGFAMARDDAFPGSSWLKVVNPRLQVPLRVIFMALVIDILLLLLPLATPLAFNAITSITTIGFQISYAIPILLVSSCSLSGM